MPTWPTSDVERLLEAFRQLSPFDQENFIASLLTYNMDALAMAKKQLQDPDLDWDEADCLTVAETARALKVTRGQVSRMVDAGRLRSNGKRGRKRRIQMKSVSIIIKLREWQKRMVRIGAPQNGQK